MMQENRIWVLMSRRLSGEASPSEEEELQLLLERFPDKQYLFGVLHSYFSASSADTSPLMEEDPDWEERFRRVVDRPVENKRLRQERSLRVSVRRFIGYAASFIALLALGWGITRVRQGQKTTPAAAMPAGNEEVQAKPGARTRLLLPDGTKVWLNSNSKLKYTNEFNIKDREVRLEGEAFFDVAKDQERPFIVHASNLEIRVLGTSFAVRSYPQDETIETTLLKGAIEVSRKGSRSTARVILKPNEKLVFNKRPDPAPGNVTADPVSGKHPAGMAINPIRQDIPDSQKVETAWIYDRLVFDGENFRQLADKMERWYDVHIIVKDEQLNHYRFGGVFANESIEEALKELQLTANFNYKINGKEIELYAIK